MEEFKFPENQLLKQWDDSAKWFADKVDTKPHNAYYERPATISLLPEVRGLKVLDAGCGPGVYTELLVKKGAEVIAIDFSEKMLEYAKKRIGNKAKFFKADLTQELAFIQSESLDLIICPLVLDSIEQIDITLEEFFRILKPRGYLIFSMGHPMHDFKYSPSGNYFLNEHFILKWSSGIDMTHFRRPLSYIINLLCKTGFILERFIEPLPTKEFAKYDKIDFEKLSKQPGFMCIRVRKSSQ
ncbi:class I SAM-dependent methyltransferase [Candidatus Hodarchaeum mangrovi]